VLVAVKKVHGMRLLSAPWRARKAIATAPVSVANHMQKNHRPAGAGPRTSS